MAYIIISSAMHFVVAELPFYSTPCINVVLSGNTFFFSRISYKKLRVWASTESFLKSSYLEFLKSFGKVS